MERHWRGGAGWRRWPLVARLVTGETLREQPLADGLRLSGACVAHRCRLSPR
ncbi:MULTISPECIES: hypothetical protein [Pseudomonas aeruginosa group]|uniref:Uncharacterized protein n=1 Tax=Pseudomonas paraeruginosa TaxID=2994495 RepID=A0A2R3J338_9PSED|nr:MULTISPECIES: hypothetical protein [Pseudomonas aeruginosa group]AVK08601.1 hypothetical protein CSB93_3713 [Pseudomonas paraeruginosa]AWE94376.1 hypothetical protein CSC28_2495 [Pseudomonas paraeruginosa]MBG3902316.1 hypothetical protein [Pseudomonas aeruginosa]MBG4280547.1 hypothetical protein [Pseudomonas aeruginosa]MBG6889941.1 hypothetical protein [Pseudomonas aeruginosa]